MRYTDDMNFKKSNKDSKFSSFITTFPFFYGLLKAFFISAMILLSGSAFAFTASDIRFYTQESGLKIYFLQDTSSPVIRLELAVQAGLSEQTEKNAGFFGFYAGLKGAAAGQNDVRFIKTSSPEQLEKSIMELSYVMKNDIPSDTELKKALLQTRQELDEYFSQPAGFINSAIDSKMFPEAPWKRSSGSVPSLFSSKTVSESRSILSSIAKNYYTPGNSTLFVSGNITEKAVLELTEKYFGPYSASPSQSKAKSRTEKLLEKAVEEGRLAKSRRYVIHDKSFSPEMTQICIQYKSLTRDQADLLSTVWNNDDSVFKKNLAKQRNLKILGAEYIDASSAQDTQASRLIIQSLLGAVKVSPVVQADLFLSKSREEQTITDEAIKSAVIRQKKELARTYEDSSKLMEQFSLFAATCPDDDKIQAFFGRNDELSSISAQSIQKAVKDETPYVFIFVNSAVYTKHQGEFKKSGYTVLTSANSLWFKQPEYEKIFASSKEEQSSSIQEDILSSAERFISKSDAEISTLALENEIPVVLKQNPNTSQVEVTLIIAGGDLLFAEETPGLSSILTGSIAVNIKNQLNLFAANNAVEQNSYKVTSQTYSTHSLITVSLPAKSLNFAIQSMHSALIFCDITPATADGVTYDERTKWRLKTGTGEFQLLCEAMRTLYNGTKYPRLFEDNKDKPAEMNFTKILEAYPALLDATRFSFAVTGGFSDQGKLLMYLNKTFGTLETHAETRIFETGLPKPVLSSSGEKELKVQLRHLFLTDIPKEKAGPMPQVLIPTTKFLDPALYCIASPDESEPDAALFNALLLEAGRIMNQKAHKAGKTSSVRVQLPEMDIPFARIIFTNVEHTQEADKIYAESIAELKDEIKSQLQLKTEGVKDLEKNDLLARLENNWIMEVISEAGTNEGTRELINMGFIKKNPKLYLQQYEAVDKAQLEDYFLIAESWLEEKAPLRLYSKDSKK